jgi:hypothetical protein
MANHRCQTGRGGNDAAAAQGKSDGRGGHSFGKITE